MKNLKLCGACGGKKFTAFTNETFLVGDEVPLHGLSGARCDSCGEVYFDDESQDRYVDAGNALVLARREAEQKMLLRVRKKLKLTQHQAARLTGGGHNAFSRYERGEARPVPAVINLFRLLDHHPELLREIQ
ncbi:MAG: type II toxin-antitoxin system MqsA family antitoxin [Gallionellaceae bacterium]|nr:type II toxin-antitoxin system MqsA family antitoxin [Gallionellaceae bacterium]